YNNRFGTSRNCLSYAVTSNVLSGSIDVRENGCSSTHHDGACRRYKTSAGNNNFIAWSYSEGMQCQLQADAAIRKRYSVLASNERGEFLLERAPLVPGPIVYLSGLKHLDGCRNIAFTKARPSCKRLLANRAPP